MTSIRRLKNKLLKQYHIDNGELGGVLAMFKQSAPYINGFTFLGVFFNAYSQYLHKYVSLHIGIIIIGLVLLSVMYFNYAFIQPSTKIFQNRQTFKHKNLIKSYLDRIKTDDIDEIREQLDRIEGRLTKMEKEK